MFGMPAEQASWRSWHLAQGTTPDLRSGRL